MCSSDTTTKTKTNAANEESLKIALAVSILRSKLRQRQPSSVNDPSNSDALKWKRKAKERKQEIIKLREDLKQTEDGSSCDLFPQSASCKCYLFDNLGNLNQNRFVDTSNQRFNDVLRRRFLRQVRSKERKRTSASTSNGRFSDLSTEDEAEQLRASVDFLVELCDTVSPAETNFSNWSHQAVEFILVSVKSLLLGKKFESLQGTVNSLITRLVRRMCTPFKEDEWQEMDTDCQYYAQHLIRKLASESYIGHSAIFSVSEKISVLAESMLFTDPFDDPFPNMHECMFIMIQLLEFLISDYLLSWSEDPMFDNTFYEEWVASVLHARKAVEILENRNELYILYMDRVVGALAKQVGQSPVLRNLKPEVLDCLFR